MGTVKNIVTEVENEIIAGDLSFYQIAEKYEISHRDVVYIAETMYHDDDYAYPDPEEVYENRYSLHDF